MKAKVWHPKIVEEAVRMHSYPGIGFVDSVTGRRAVLAGTGLEVWEVIATWRATGEDEERLRATFDWLTPAQLRAALAYFHHFPEEIERRLALEDTRTPERLRKELRFATLGPGLTDEKG